MSEDYQDEMSKLDSMGAGRGGITLPYSESTDHKHVMLYTHLNKRVGSMTVDNAKQTMMRWNRKGIALFTSPRTEAQIAEYKETPLYKRLHQEWKDQRERRHKQSKTFKPEDMSKLIATETAKAVATEMTKAIKPKKGKKNETA